MVYGGYEYIDFSYEPSEKDFVVLAWIKAKTKLEKAAEAVAAESSVGTWTDIKTMNSYVFENYRARIFKITKVSENSGFVYIAYPYEHFDTKNLCQFWASVFGNVFGMKELEELYYLDLKIPEKFQKQFEGPLYGLEGVREYVGTKSNRRPHIGTIVKPKVGLNPEEFAKVCYESWVGGLDLVKDDENLVDQDFCKWRDRFDKVFDALDKAESETGEKKMYLTNITDVSLERMYERIDYIKERGHKQVMLDVYILGFPALNRVLQETRKAKLITHAHRAGYAAWHRGNFGINFGILEKVYRLLGVDQLHIGTGVGKMEGGTLLINYFHKIAVERELEEKEHLGFLTMKFADHIKPLMPVASGGLDPTKVDALIVVHGKDVTIQAGGGVHGHPDGTLAGAKALRQAVDIVTSGYKTIDEKEKYPELQKAFDKWGYTDPKEYEKILSIEDEIKDLLVSIVRKSGLSGIRSVWEL